MSNPYDDDDELIGGATKSGVQDSPGGTVVFGEASHAGGVKVREGVVPTPIDFDPKVAGTGFKRVSLRGGGSVVPLSRYRRDPRKDIGTQNVVPLDQALGSIGTPTDVVPWYVVKQGLQKDGVGRANYDRLVTIVYQHGLRGSIVPPDVASLLQRLAAYGDREAGLAYGYAVTVARQIMAAQRS